MANNRLNQNISISTKFNKKLTVYSQLLYLLLLAHVDDFGTMLADSEDIKAIVAPKNDILTIEIIRNAEKELLKSGICIFYTYNDKPYLQIVDFVKFQIFGTGYNRTPHYPPYNERDHSRVTAIIGALDPNLFKPLKKTSDLLRSLKKTYSVSTTSSYYNTNTNTYKKEQIENLNLSLEEKELLKCFYELGFKLKENDLESWKKWVAEQKKDYPNKDLIVNVKDWRDYFENKHPKRHKVSFRNWISKDYAKNKMSNTDFYIERKGREFEERIKNLKK